MARVVFLQRIWHEFGGPQVISAVLQKHGYAAELFIGPSARAFINKIGPDDLIAFSAMSGEHHWALEVCAEIKKKKQVLSVFGGPHATYFPKLIRHPAVDIVCRGEGEYAMLDLMEALSRGKDYSHIPNLLVKHNGEIKENPLRPLILDLDSLPFPERRIYYKYRILKNNPLRIFMAGRGCVFSCSFCFNEKLRGLYSGKGEYVRFRSPGNLVAELEETAQEFGLGSVYFVDDLFVLNKNWLRVFLDLYQKRINKPFICSAHINTLDEEIIKLLKGAGCHAVSFGIETGNESLRERLLNKQISNSQIIAIGRLLKRYRLKSIAFNMLGLPAETPADSLETIELNIKAKITYPRCALLTPYPGTKIAEAAKKNVGLEEIQSSHQQFKLSFSVPQPGELYNLHCFFQTAVIFPKTLGAIKRLSKFSPNILFKLWWIAVYFCVFIKSEARSPKQVFWSSLKTFWPRIKNILRSSLLNEGAF